MEMSDVAVGDRLRLWDGYTLPPPWLSGRPFVDGTVERWFGDDRRPACLVRLDATLTVRQSREGQARETIGGFVVLTLRMPNRWEHRGVVQIALCDDDPSDAWTAEGAGVVVETHAMYERLTR
jgi:hypothetical protein